MEQHERARKGERDFEKWCDKNGFNWLRGKDLIEAVRNWRAKEERIIFEDGRFDRAVLNWIRANRKLAWKIEEWDRIRGIAGIFDYVIWKSNRVRPFFVDVKTGDSLTLTRSQLEFYLKFRIEGSSGFAIFMVLPTGETGRASYHLIVLDSL